MSTDRDDDRSEFERLLGEKRRGDRDKLRPEPDPRVKPTAAGGERPASFRIERAGEQHVGWVDGVDARTRRKLRRGDFPVERRLDLHGMDAVAAERYVRLELARALEAGERCVLVVHGRGLHSEGEPALKQALPGWLARPPHGSRVLAFTTVAPERGGSGATCVLLRRRRPER